MQTMINAQFRTFNEAVGALGTLVHAFAMNVHPYYVKNAWVLWNGYNTDIPTVEQIANTVSHLLDSIKTQARRNYAYSSTGRITVEVIRAGRYFIPRMFIDTLSTDNMLVC